MLNLLRHWKKDAVMVADFNVLLIFVKVLAFGGNYLPVAPKHSVMLLDLHLIALRSRLTCDIWPDNALVWLR